MMVSKLKILVLSVALFATGVSQAEMIFFDSSFTTADGFTDGGIGTGGSNPDTIIGQGGFLVSDSSGVGTLTGGSNGSFQRALFGWNQGLDASGVNSAIEVRVSVTGLVFNATGRNVARFGLSDVNDGNPLGSSSLAGGVRFARRGSDSSIFLDTDVNDGSFDFDINTGFIVGEQFDYEQRWLALGGGAFNIDHYINGSNLGTTLNVTPTFGGSQVTGFIQDSGNAGVYSMDSLRLSTFSAVPEPSSLGLFAIGIAAFAGRRKRR